MPTVPYEDGFRVMIFTQDHAPAHVHVFAKGFRAVVLLNGPNGPPTLREYVGFKRQELKAIFDLITNNLPLLCQTWDDIHVH